MRITYNKIKRQEGLTKHGLDFKDAAIVFKGETFEFIDERKDYGEERIIAVGHLEGRMVLICYTQRGIAKRIISMRKANEREVKTYKERFEKG